MATAVEARVIMANPTDSIRKQFYQLTKGEITARQKGTSKEQAAVEAERVEDAPQAGAEAEVGWLDAHAELVSRINEESMCREHF